MTFGKFLGCVMMVVGSAIGAGILATPMVSAFAGFTATVAVILIMWILLTVSGLLVVEVCSALPPTACSFNSMAEKTLGPLGRTVTWVSYLLLLYATLCAYISGEPQLISDIVNSVFGMQIPLWLLGILFSTILGSAVFWSTKTVDYLNRGLIGTKGLLLVTTLVLTVTYIDVNKLFVVEQGFNQTKHVLAASPVLLCLFNYHFVIPSLRMYIGDKPQALKWIIVTGTTLALIVYLLWLATTLGTIPLSGASNSFTSISQAQDSLGAFIRTFGAIVSNKWVKLSIKCFANISMTTSFLGVSLGLFDFLADGFKRPNTRWGRLQTAALTFIPPIIFTIYYPNGFVMALSYSGVFIAVLCLILPAIMAYRLRSHTEPAVESPYRVACGKASFAVIIFVGAVFFVYPILNNLGLLSFMK